MGWINIVILWVLCAAFCTALVFEEQIKAWERKWLDFFAECKEKGIPKSRIIKGFIYVIFHKEGN